MIDDAGLYEEQRSTPLVTKGVDAWFSDTQKMISKFEDNINTELLELQEKTNNNMRDIKTTINMLLTIYPPLFKMIKNPTADQAEIAVEGEPFVFKDVPRELQTYIMRLKVVRKQGSLLQWICDEDKTYEICWNACLNDPLAIEHAKKEYQYKILQKLIDKDPGTPALKIMGPKLSQEQRDYVITHCCAYQCIEYLPDLTLNEAVKIIEKELHALRYMRSLNSCILGGVNYSDVLEHVAMRSHIEAIHYCQSIPGDYVYFAIMCWIKTEPLRLIQTLVDKDTYLDVTLTKRQIKLFIELCPRAEWVYCKDYIPKKSLGIRLMCWKKSRRCKHGK